jgi:hypothetical protein
MMILEGRKESAVFEADGWNILPTINVYEEECPEGNGFLNLQQLNRYSVAKKENLSCITCNLNSSLSILSGLAKKEKLKILFLHLTCFLKRNRSLFSKFGFFNYFLFPFYAFYFDLSLNFAGIYNFTLESII